MSVDDQGDLNMDALLVAVSQRVEEEEENANLKKKETDQNTTLALINRLGMLEQKPVVKLLDLTVGHPYIYIQVRAIKTQFHDRTVVVELSEHIVYLPKRFAGMSEEQIDLLNKLRNDLVFIYDGPQEMKAGNPTSLVGFIKRGELII